MGIQGSTNETVMVSVLVAGAYFLACVPKRPRRQTQRELGWGSSR